MRLLLDAPWTLQSPPVDPAAANSLFTFLAQRLGAIGGAAAPGLNCAGLLHAPDPILVTTDQNGVAISATIYGINPAQP
jgi:hypothetical protein